jgi:hypothetical protein
LTLLYSAPREALVKLGGDPARTLSELMNHFGQFPAPPRFERPCGIQEVESIACKHAAHLNGTYFIGKDIKEVRHSLIGWGATAAKLLQHMPPEATADAAAPAEPKPTIQAEATPTIESDSSYNKTSDHREPPAADPVVVAIEPVPLAKGTIIDGVDCSGMIDDPKRAGIPVHLQTQNRKELTAEQKAAIKRLDAAEPKPTNDTSGIEVIRSIKPREADPNVIYYDEVPPSEDTFNNAVADITDILTRHERDLTRHEGDQRRIGERAAEVGKAYGENRIGELARKVGLKEDTLRRYRAVAKLAKEIEDKHALGRVLNYSAVRELVPYPDVAEREFKKNPGLTKKQAQGIKRRQVRKEKATPAGRRKDLEKALRALVATAATAERLELKHGTDGRLLKEILAKSPALAKELANLRAKGDSIHRSADFYDHRDEYIAATAAGDSAREAARQSLAQKRAQALKPDDREADDADPSEEKETVH